VLEGIASPRFAAACAVVMIALSCGCKQDEPKQDAAARARPTPAPAPTVNQPPPPPALADFGISTPDVGPIAETPELPPGVAPIPPGVPAPSRPKDMKRSPNPSPQESRAEFELFAARLAASEHPYFGKKQLVDTMAKLPMARQSANPMMYVQGLAVMANHLLRCGYTREAVDYFRQAKQAAIERHMPPDVLQVISVNLAVAEMRAGELDNCVARHTAESCIMPIRGGGVHQDQRGVRAAIAEFLEFLKARPDDWPARWLLHICVMAVGEFPQGVPVEYRLPPGTFDSEYDCKPFTDIAPQLGVNAFDQAGGAIMDDFDNDGCMDLVCTTSLPAGQMHYFHNNGSGGFDDWTERAGLGGQWGGLNCVQADFNNDGHLDVLVMRGGWMGELGMYCRRSLLRNNGDNTFTDITPAAGLADPMFPSQAADWADYDGDGDLDLYVGNELPLDGVSPAFPSQLFRNNNDGTFTDVAERAGVRNDQYVKGVDWGDYDNDGDADLYVSNIGRGPSHDKPNRLYRNNGDGTFTDVTGQLGVTGSPGRNFGTWWFDYDNDGWLDLYVVGYDCQISDIAAWYFRAPDRANRTKLYHNRGDGTFEDVSRPAGLDRPMLTMGCNYGDLDNDGWLDFYLGTGGPQFEALCPNLMFRNDGGKRFIDVTFAGGFGHLQKGHGVAFGDIDNDGDQDIWHQLGGFVYGDPFGNVLFENPGHGNHWIALKCVGVTSNRQAVGARIRVRVKTAAGASRDIHEAVGTGASFGGNTLQAEIGLGDATQIEEIEVWWPRTGERQKFTHAVMDRFYEIREGDGALHPLERKVIAFH